MAMRDWTADSINQLMRGYQASCILTAAVELDVFTTLTPLALTAAETADRRAADRRGMRTLLDSLAALGLLEKNADRYRTPPSVAAILAQEGSQQAMALHQANCLRHWAQLAAVVQTGQPAQREPSIRGGAADYAAFVEAMDNTARPAAPSLIAALPPLTFTHLLDVGGASGTYTIAFLQAYPAARGTLFDLPPVIPQARARLSAAGLMERVTLVPGDFYRDALPAGADLAWVSAIIHQNSRPQNRDLFARIARALPRGGQILIRDFIMDESRTTPPGGALFAINMLVNTPAGGTFTLAEVREDLESAGFGGMALLRRDETMNSVVSARKA